MKKYNHLKIEKKWQKYWQEKGIFKTKTPSKKKKIYILDMFPYPSGYGLHVGHMRGYTFTDLLSKKRLMEGFEVLHPMGWDAFGLPAENYAIKTGIHPEITTQRNIKNIKRQLNSAGYGYDWDKEVDTSSPDYYKWTQWLFLELFKAGLAYKKKAPVNWCPSCKTVLANEQVINGRCERCGTEVKQKYLEQWFLKITAYAERLLKDLDNLDWPENIKEMQRNWIGKSEGAMIKFHVPETGSQIEVFTTRPDTLFGATYLVLAPEHPFVSSLLKNQKLKVKNYKLIESYIKKTKNKAERERVSESKEKTGVEIKGVKAVNPANEKKIPIFIADYVLPYYGTGAIMAVPAHDQRDFEFAKKFNLPIKTVIKPKSKSQTSRKTERAFEEYGFLVNSQQFSGLSSEKAKKEIVRWLKQKGLAKESIQYKLRDWLVSRQRYWGVPIPIIYCPKHGLVPVPKKDLPVKLPRIKDFLPTGDGKSPLAKSEKFTEARCPICGAKAVRETETLDTFVDSSWYYLRYPDAKNKKAIFSQEKIKKWLPVDIYIGGAEHAVLHLLYSRFITKFLYDKGYIKFNEPFLKLYNPGTIYRNGVKMSKSKGNVVNPDDFIKTYGADTMRVYELFLGPGNQATEWQDKGVVGCRRFLQKIWKLEKKIKKDSPRQSSSKNREIEKLVHQTVKKVTEDIESFHFNTAISSLMILTNKFAEEEKISQENFEILLKLIAPIAPHIAEELWFQIGHKKSIFKEKWPRYNSKLAKEEKFSLIIQVNGKTRSVVEVNLDISAAEAKKIALRKEKIKNYIPEEKKIKKVIFVKNKLINFLYSK